jgi:hypothetical protein
VAQPTDLAHEVLIRVAEFLRTLPAEHLADLASGVAKLEVVPKGGRRAAPVKAAVVALDRPAQEIAATMAEIGDRTQARRYLEIDLKMTVPKLKQLALDLGITATGAKPKLLDAIVEWAVGRKQDSLAIDRAVNGGR